MGPQSIKCQAEATELTETNWEIPGNNNKEKAPPGELVQNTIDQDKSNPEQHVGHRTTNL